VHGCIGSAGYRWCVSMSECIRPWEHNLTSQNDIVEHCGDSSSGTALAGTETHSPVGGDSDAHGCIRSAGYRWCASRSECIRPWEQLLTNEHDIAEHCGESLGSQAFVGGDHDAHDCINSAGYRWCASMSECIRPWEHNLVSEHDIAEHCGGSSSESTAPSFAAENGKQGFVGGDRDVHGCIGSAGYRWCVSMSECIRPWEHNLTSQNDIVEHCGDSSSGTALAGQKRLLVLLEVTMMRMDA